MSSTSTPVSEGAEPCRRFYMHWLFPGVLLSLGLSQGALALRAGDTADAAYYGCIAIIGLLIVFVDRVRGGTLIADPAGISQLGWRKRRLFDFERVEGWRIGWGGLLLEVRVRDAAPVLLSTVVVGNSGALISCIEEGVGPSDGRAHPRTRLIGLALVAAAIAISAQCVIYLL